jgi:hypothetical protein
MTTYEILGVKPSNLPSLSSISFAASSATSISFPSFEVSEVGMKSLEKHTPQSEQVHSIKQRKGDNYGKSTAESDLLSKVRQSHINGRETDDR